MGKDYSKIRNYIYFITFLYSGSVLSGRKKDRMAPFAKIFAAKGNDDGHIYRLINCARIEIILQNDIVQGAMNIAALNYLHALMKKGVDKFELLHVLRNSYKYIKKQRSKSELRDNKKLEKKHWQTQPDVRELTAAYNQYSKQKREIKRETGKDQVQPSVEKLELTAIVHKKKKVIDKDEINPYNKKQKVKKPNKWEGESQQEFEDNKKRQKLEEEEDFMNGTPYDNIIIIKNDEPDGVREARELELNKIKIKREIYNLSIKGQDNVLKVISAKRKEHKSIYLAKEALMNFNKIEIDELINELKNNIEYHKYGE